MKDVLLDEMRCFDERSERMREGCSFAPSAGGSVCFSEKNQRGASFREF
jgi:hypothetical protein